ncbi:MAG: aminoglycoside phosphotransferase family protein [Bacteroidota bacterium]
MQTRKGRLNEIRFVAADAIQKIAAVKESRRPLRLKVESWALSMAHKCGVNVPKVFDYFVNSDGQEVLVIERIPQCVLLTRCSPREQTIYMFDAGRQMALLNQSANGYGWIDATTFQGCYGTWKEFLSSYINIFGSRLSTAKIIDPESIAKIAAIVRNVDLSLDFPYLLHRDLKLSNLLVDKKSRVWIVDWENAILGDPLYDLAIVGVREGHNFIWQNLVRGRSLEVDSQRYRLYEALALFGFLDFGRRYGQQYKGLRKQLVKLLNAL